MAKEKKKLSRAQKRPADNGRDNAFLRAIVASRRAKEILMGDKPLVEGGAMHPCLIALEEIRKGRVKYKVVK